MKSICLNRVALALCVVVAGCDETPAGEDSLEVVTGRSAVELEIDGRGGVLELESRARLTVPPGALDNGVTIRAEEGDLGSFVRSPDGFEVIGKPLVVTPHGQKLMRAATIELAIDDLESPRRDLRVLRLDDAKDRTWEERDDLRLLAANEVGRSERDNEFERPGDEGVTASRRIEFEVDGFSVFLPVRVVRVEGECVGKNRGDVCRASAGACDVAEVCDGTNAACPEDELTGRGSECRASSGLCDVAEVCDGDSAACPENEVRAADSVCRPTRGDCDEAEVCDGVGAECPENGYASAGECRESAGACDVAESCDGSGPDCPADEMASTDTECRAADGLCDVAESCDGSGPTCPVDRVAAARTECEAATGCNAAASCDGTSNTCPAPLPAALGTLCDDGYFCTAVDTCDGVGGCAGSGDPCAAEIDDGDADCSETCDEGAGACSGNDPDGGSCDPGLACAAGQCAGGSCTQTGPCPVFVATDGTDDGTCGADWDTACLTVEWGSQRAASTSNPRVFVQQGTYLAAGAAPMLTMLSGVSYYGSFVGTEDNVNQRPDPIANFSVIDGNQLGSTVVMGASNALLDGFDIVGGSSRYGAGMYNVSLLNLTVQHSRFSSNQGAGASAAGAGMYNSGISNLRVSDVTFDGNTLGGGATEHGAGMYNEDSTATLTDVLFVDNEISSASSGRGAGLYDTDTDTVLTRVRFDANRINGPGAGGGYAGVVSGVHTSELSDVVFEGNTVVLDVGSASGGGMYFDGGNVTMSRTSFLQNSVGGTSSGGAFAGGGAWLSNTTAELDRTRFVDNGAFAGGAYASGYGGGVYATNVELTMSDVGFVRNRVSASSSGGAALYQEGTGFLDLENGSLVENDGRTGLWVGAPSVSIDHTSFFENGGGDLELSGTVTGASVRNSAFEGSGGITDNGVSSTFDYVCSGVAMGTNHVLSSGGDMELSASGDVYLTSGSACADASAGAEATADAVYGVGAWQSMVTSLDGTADGPAVDLGRHYDAQQVTILSYSDGPTTANWTVRAPAGTVCELVGQGYSYTVPPGDVAAGNVVHGEGLATRTLTCWDQGAVATVTFDPS